MIYIEVAGKGKHAVVVIQCTGALILAKTSQSKWLLFLRPRMGYATGRSPERLRSAGFLKFSREGNGNE